MTNKDEINFKMEYEVPTKKEERKLKYSKSGRWWRLLQAKLRHGKRK